MMDNQFAGPSGSKSENKRTLDEIKLEYYSDHSDSDIEPFEDNASDCYDESSSSELEEDTPERDNSPVIDNKANIPTVVQPIEPVWDDIPNLKVFRFTGKPGMKHFLQSDDPIDFARMFFGVDFFNQLVTETNRYAETLFLSETIRAKSRITSWKPVTVPEMEVFLGLWLHMGHININRLQDYWKTDELYSIPCFSKSMARNRFLGILKCLHFSKTPEIEEPGYGDRLTSIRWMQDFFNNRMDEVYYPNKQLSLDESMVLLRGRLVFRQYIKNKLHKYEVKLYKLSEPNGLVLKTHISTGTDGDMVGNLGHTANVVLCLLDKYLNTGHSIYMDNYYNSYILAKELLKKSTYITGTLSNTKKWNPKAVIDKKLARGEITIKYTDGVTIGKWRDKRQVTFISTEFNGDLELNTNRRGQRVEMSNVIHHYNRHMSGIERQDQMLSYYCSERKTIRWYKKMGMHIMSMMMLNSYHLYNKYSTQKKLSFYDFRHIIIKIFISSQDVIGAPTKPTLPPVTVSNHLPQKLQLDSMGRQMRKRCRVCYVNKIRKETPFYCPACPDKPGLCLATCFQTHHGI